MLPNSPTNSETQKYYQHEPKFDGVYRRSNLPRIKDRACVISFDDYESIWTHCIDLYVNGNNVTYFDGFGVEHIPKEIKNIIGNKNIVTNIYRIQVNSSIMRGYFCIGFYVKF